MSPDLLKDLFGLIGSIVMIVPFFRDFAERRLRGRMNWIRSVMPSLAGGIDKLLKQQTAEMEKASPFDLGCMLIGLAFLIASFAVSLWISAHAAH